MLRPLIHTTSTGIGVRMFAHHAARAVAASSSTARLLHSRNSVHSRANPLQSHRIYRSSLLCGVSPASSSSTLLLSAPLPRFPSSSLTRSFTSTPFLHSALTDLFAWHRAPLRYSPELAALEPQLFAFVSQQLARQHGEEHTHTQTSPQNQRTSSHHIHTTKHSQQHSSSSSSSPAQASYTPTPSIQKGGGGGGGISLPPPPPPPPHLPPSSGGDQKDHTGDGGGGGGGKGEDPAHGAGSATYASQAREITSTLLASLHLSSRTRLRSVLLGLAGALGLAGLLIYVFRDPLKANLSEQTADVAKRSLTSSEVQLQVNALSADVVQTLLANPAVLGQCQAFVGRLLALPETRRALVALLAATAQDPQALDVLSKFSARLLAELMARPDTLAQLTALLRAAITSPGNELALQVLFKSFAADPKTQAMLAELAKRAAVDVLNDPAVRDTAKQALKDVTADASVQKSTGDAMWNAVKYSLKPHWLGAVTSASTSASASAAAAPHSPASHQTQEQINQEADATPDDMDQNISPPPYSEVATEAAIADQQQQQQQQATTTTTTTTTLVPAQDAATSPTEPAVTVQQTEDTRDRTTGRDIEPPVKALSPSPST